MNATLALKLVRIELAIAEHKFGPFASSHEGKAVIEEELDELWEHVKGNTGRSTDALHEAIQVAAMGLRYAVSLCTDSQGEWLLDALEHKQMHLNRVDGAK